MGLRNMYDLKDSICVYRYVPYDCGIFVNVSSGDFESQESPWNMSV